MTAMDAINIAEKAGLVAMIWALVGLMFCLAWRLGRGNRS